MLSFRNTLHLRAAALASCSIKARSSAPRKHNRVCRGQGKLDEQGQRGSDRLVYDYHLRRNKLISQLHERMPVILKELDYEAWLSGSVSEATDLMKPFPAQDVLTYFVSKKVNRASYDAPDVIARAD